MTQNPRFERLKALQQKTGIDAFLFTSASSVKWLSGFFYNFETGPSPFQLLPSALLVVPGQLMCLVIADNEDIAVSAGGLSVTFKTYSSYVYEQPLDFTSQFLTKMHEAIQENGMAVARLGIESGSFPLVLWETFRSKFPDISLVDTTADIATLKAVKDMDEIKSISEAAGLCDIGQEAVLKHSEAGMTELGLFNLVRMEIELAAGTRIPLMADLVSGTRTASGGGIPSNGKLQNKDTVLSDLTPCLNGYWGDSCNTIFIGNPTSDQRKTFARVHEALDIAINAIHPGIKALEIDHLMREHIGNFPHHGGHGVGTMYHEEPRITPYNQMELIPGMVIALEPGIYHEKFGIRLEHMVVVTNDGCELLTQFRHHHS